MEMLLALSIGAVVIVGCASTAITFINLWAREGKHDLSKERDYTVSKTLSEEMFKAIFESIDDIDFKALPENNNLENTYLHWRSYDEPLPFIENASKAIYVDCWLVFNNVDKTLDMHYKVINRLPTNPPQGSSGESNDNKTKTVPLLTNCLGIKYLYFTPGSGNSKGSWESSSTPKSINNEKTGNQEKWIIPDLLTIFINNTINPQQ
jgi:hypothetical protein